MRHYIITVAVSRTDGLPTSSGFDCVIAIVKPGSVKVFPRMLISSSLYEKRTPYRVSHYAANPATLNYLLLVLRASRGYFCILFDLFDPPDTNF